MRAQKTFLLIIVSIFIMSCRGEWRGLNTVELIPLTFQSDIVKTADLDEDGLKDIISLNKTHHPDAYADGNHYITILRNRGEGRFHSSIYAAGGSPKDIIVANFNPDEDSDLDILLLQHHGVFSIYWGEGYAEFSRRMELDLPVDRNILSLGHGDLNQDGFVDLVFASERRLYISYGLGNKRFSGHFHQIQIESIRHIKIHDFDNDGQLDILVKSDHDYSLIQRVENAYEVSLRWRASPHLEEDQAVIVDIDQDRMMDLVFTSSDHRICYLRGRDENFGINSEPLTVPSEQCVLVEDYHQIRGLDIADYNNDSFPDLLVLTQPYKIQNNQNVYNESSSILIFENSLESNDSVVFQNYTKHPQSFPPLSRSLIYEDIDGDDYKDFILGNSYYSHISLLRGFKQNHNLPLNKAVNHNIDPRMELDGLSLGYISSTDRLGVLSHSYSYSLLDVYEDQGSFFATGDYLCVDSFQSFNPVDMELRDVDGDGYDELFILNISNQVLFFNNYEGQYSLSEIINIDRTYTVMDIAVAELNPDSRDEFDLLVMVNKDGKDYFNWQHYTFAEIDNNFYYRRKDNVREPRSALYQGVEVFKDHQGQERAYLIKANKISLLKKDNEKMDGSHLYAEDVINFHRDIAAVQAYDYNNDQKLDIFLMTNDGDVYYFEAMSQDGNIFLHPEGPLLRLSDGRHSIYYNTSPSYDRRSRYHGTSFDRVYFFLVDDFNKDGAPDFVTYFWPRPFLIQNRAEYPEYLSPLLKFKMSKNGSVNFYDRIFYDTNKEVGDLMRVDFGIENSFKDVISMGDRNEIKILLNLGNYD